MNIHVDMPMYYMCVPSDKTVAIMSVIFGCIKNHDET